MLTLQNQMTPDWRQLACFVIRDLRTYTTGILLRFCITRKATSKNDIFKGHNSLNSEKVISCRFRIGLTESFLNRNFLFK